MKVTFDLNLRICTTSFTSEYNLNHSTFQWAQSAFYDYEVMKMWQNLSYGGMIFYEKGGSICDELSQIFSGPPFDHGKKTGPPSYEWEKNSGPPSDKI